jgi:hypothetical protein
MAIQGRHHNGRNRTIPILAAKRGPIPRNAVFLAGDRCASILGMERLPTAEIERIAAKPETPQGRRQRAWLDRCRRTRGRLCAAEAWARSDGDAELTDEPEPADTS